MLAVMGVFTLLAARYKYVDEDYFEASSSNEDSDASIQEDDKKIRPPPPPLVEKEAYC